MPSQSPACGPLHEATQIPGNAFIRIKAKHPFELQLCACNLQHKSTMSTLGDQARLDVLFPCPICHDQGDFRVAAKNFQRPIRARVIICDDRIHMLADVIQGVGQNQRLVAQARDPDQKVLSAE